MYFEIKILFIQHSFSIECNSILSYFEYILILINKLVKLNEKFDMKRMVLKYKSGFFKLSSNLHKIDFLGGSNVETDNLVNKIVI